MVVNQQIVAQSPRVSIDYINYPTTVAQMNLGQPKNKAQLIQSFQRDAAASPMDYFAQQLDALGRRSNNRPEVVNLSFGMSPVRHFLNVKRLLDAKGTDEQYLYPQLRQEILNNTNTEGQSDNLKIWHFLTKEVYTNPQYASTLAASQQRWQEAVARAAERDILVVKSAGNSYDQIPPELTSWEDQLRFTRDYMWAPQMVMVGATDERGRPTAFTTPGSGRLDDGTSPQIAMQGSGIPLSPGARASNPGWRFETETQGTSFAAPQVTGVVARMEEIARAAGRDLTPEEIRAILFRSTTPVTPPVDRLAQAQTGYGILSPELAYTNTTAYLNETR